MLSKHNVHMSYACGCRDYGKTKSEKTQPKGEPGQKAKKPKEKKEGEGEWETVVKKGSGQMTKQVQCILYLCMYTYMYIVHCKCVHHLAHSYYVNCRTQIPNLILLIVLLECTMYMYTLMYVQYYMCLFMCRIYCGYCLTRT